MEIRKMKDEDYDQVYQLWMACTGMGLNDVDDSKEGIANFLHKNPDTCFVAMDAVKNTIIGTILVGSDGRRGYIYHASVHPDYRKEGIGKSLVDASLESLKQLGIHKVALVVFERNEIGNHFWEHMGFSARNDLVYRNKALSELKRIDT